MWNFFICACTCSVCMFEMCVVLHVWRPEDNAVSSSTTVHLSFLWWSLSLDLEFMFQQDCLTSESLGSTCFCPTVLSLQGSAILPCFYNGAGNPNSGSHACEVDMHFLPQNQLLRPQYWGLRTSRKWNKYSLFLYIYYNIILLYHSFIYYIFTILWFTLV